MPDFGNALYTIVAFVVALSIIVTVHEYGHYIIGRLSGIRAEAFSIGFGPKLISHTDRRGTVWKISAIPLGGYVKFLGDANAASAGVDEEAMSALSAEERRHTMHGAPLWARAATVAAGPLFNFVLSALIFAGFMLLRGVPVEAPTVGELAPVPPGVEMALQPGDDILAIDGHPVASWADLFRAAETVPAAPGHDWTVRRAGVEMTVRGPDPMPARIGGVAPGGAAAAAGLHPGDVVLQVNTRPIARFDALRTHVEAAQGQPLTLRIWRDGATQDVTLTPKEQDLPRAEGGFEKRWLIGITADNYFAPATEAVGPISALWQGVAQVGSIIQSSLTGLWAMVTGQIGACNLGGAISIAESTGQAANAGLANFIWWIGILSVAIGFLNLLPIPVLDGGHLAFYAWEAVSGRPPSPRARDLLSGIGLALVVGLMIFGLSNDLRC